MQLLVNRQCGWQVADGLVLELAGHPTGGRKDLGGVVDAVGHAAHPEQQHHTTHPGYDHGGYPGEPQPQPHACITFLMFSIRLFSTCSREK